MSTTTKWQDFCMLYYDQAISNARYYLNQIKSQRGPVDKRIDEDSLIVDVAIEALQKAFEKYDPSRGASQATFLSRLVHNELINAFKREEKALATSNEITPGQEAEYTVKEMACKIPEKALENLKEKLRAAILKLSPVDQSILGFFMDDPHTFVERSVEELGVTPGFVSVHKNRAIARLPELMGVSAADYYEMFEERQYAGFLMASNKPIATSSYVNPVSPHFDLDSTIMKLYAAVNTALKENI